MEPSVTLQEVDLFHEARGNLAWADADLEVRSPAIVRATDYILTEYSFRDGVEPDDARLIRAICELSLIALSQSLVEVITPGVVREKLDGVGEVQYSDQVIEDRFPTITKILRPIISGGQTANQPFFASAVITL